MDITIKLNERNIDENNLISDLQKIANENNFATLSTKEYKENGGKYGVNTFRRRFGSWNNALTKAGLSLSTNNLKYSQIELYENYINVCENLGKQASGRDMGTEFSKVSTATYENHFGSWNNFIAEFVEYLNTGELNY